MPTERRKPPAGLEETLREELAAEYRLGDASPNAEPRIILEETDGPAYLHVYVVWKKWRPLSGTMRSRVIMEAMEDVLPPEEFHRITLAWGLTPEEWAQVEVPETG